MPRPPPTPSLFPYTTLFRSKTTLIELDRRIRENPAYDVRASLVLACGARSCAYAHAPAFRAENLDAQLDQTIARTLREGRSIDIDEETKEIRILPIFFMYQEAIEDWLTATRIAPDFERWIVANSPDPEALRTLLEQEYALVSQELIWEIDRAE